MHDEQLSDLIGQIYDAALDPALWPDVLGEARKFVRGSAAALYWKDAAPRNGGVTHDDGGIDPHYRRLYFEKYAKLDPITTGHYLAATETPVAAADVMPHDGFVETRIYQEWVRPQGIVDCVSAPLEKSNTTVALSGVFRDERDGIVDDETRRRMRLIVPHIRRAALIGRTIDTKTAQAASLADTFDGIAAGMFLVDARGRVIHANGSGHAMLAAGDVLRAGNGRIVVTDADAHRRLYDLLADAGRGDAAVGIKGVALPLLAHNGDRHVVHVLPLTAGARRRAGKSYAAVAALFVCKASLETPSPAEVIARTYRLTPTELRVLLAIVEVGGAPEVAEALGIADTTVKTHLGRLYGKTGARRHADLVKLVAEFSSPLVG